VFPEKQITIGYRSWVFVIFLLGIGEGFLGTFFPIIFLYKGGSLFTLGVISGIISLGGTIQIVWGRLIDKYGVPKKIVIGSLTINIISAGVMGISPNSPIYGGGRMSNSFANNAYANANQFLRSAYFETKHRGKIGNIFMASNLLGISISSLLAGFFYQYYGYNWSWIIHIFAVVVFFLALIIYNIKVPEFNPKLARDEQFLYAQVIESANLEYSKSELWEFMKRSKGLIPFMLGYLIFHFGVALTAPYFIVDLQNRWRFSSIQLAALIAFNSIIQVTVISVIIPFIDFIDRKNLFTYALILAILPVIGLLFVPSLIQSIFGSNFIFWILVYFISSIGWGIINATLLTLIIDYVHPQIRGLVISGFAAIQALMSFVASILGGTLLDFVFKSSVHLFLTSVLIRFAGFLLLVKVESPPIPFADYYTQRRIFMERIRTTFERGITWIPVVNNIYRKNHYK
jgi:MFS family permease